MSSEQFIQGIIGGLAIGCIYSLIALGITIIIRATEILHFAQGELMMIGAMAGLSAMWMVDLPFVFVLLVGMIGGGVAAVAIELSIYRTLRTLRVPLINIVIATLGVSLILQNAARLIWGSEPLRYPPLFRARGIDIARLRDLAAAHLDRRARVRDDGRLAIILPLYPPRHCDAGGGAGSRSRATNGDQREKNHHLHVRGGRSDGGRRRRAAGLAVFRFV